MLSDEEKKEYIEHEILDRHIVLEEPEILDEKEKGKQEEIWKTK